MLKKLASEYFKQNMPEKGEKVLRKILEYVPYDSNPYEELAAYFFGRQQYDSAIVYQNKLHSFTRIITKRWEISATATCSRTIKIKPWNISKRRWPCMVAYVCIPQADPQPRRKKRYLQLLPGSGRL